MVSLLHVDIADQVGLWLGLFVLVRVHLLLLARLLLLLLLLQLQLLQLLLLQLFCSVADHGHRQHDRGVHLVDLGALHGGREGVLAASTSHFTEAS